MIGLVTIVLLARMLTKQEVGVYLLAFSIITVGAVIGSWGAKTMVWFVAESMALNQFGQTRRGSFDRGFTSMARLDP
jgi:hypothetical protein